LHKEYLLENLNLLVFPWIPKFFFKIGKWYCPNELKPEEEKAARGPYKCLQISEGWVSGGWGQALFSGAQ